MIKRTMGLSLLGLLVISGLAGRLTNNSLTKPERKKALSMMKETKSSLLEQVSELSKNQWLFKPASKNRNIQEYIIHIAATENKLWRLLEQAMKSPSSQARRSAVELNDEELIRLAENQSEAMIACDPFPAVLKNNKNYKEPLEDFKKQRLDHIRYMRTSTEDLRNHVVRLSFGTIDCYQLCLLISAHTERHFQDILQITKDPSFPK